MKIEPEKCVNCISCQLACSYLHTGIFNPSVSKIKIKPGCFNGEVWTSNEISFDGCKDGCVFCINYCMYGAIERD
jgi:Fe-S-cluster-containing dehydrogenase component